MEEIKVIKYPNNIKKLIYSRGLSLREVSDLTTIPYSTICKMAEWTLDIYKSQYNILSHLAKFLHCGVEDFFKDTNIGKREQ